jgi:tRNA nucleotidyltransferase (CCA-adding enzyme)
MEVPAPDVLLARIRALPGAPAVLDAVGDAEGVYLVGGAVRDLLLRGAPPDLDLVLDGDPAPLVERIGGELRAYDRFGTATVVLDGHTYDFARSRRERYPAPGALPEVEPAAVAEDLERRDFTVNAIAIELGGAGAGELRAAPAALADLEARRLRVLHERSFIDDPTRLLRLARYAARLNGFEIEPRTAVLAENAIAGGALGTLTGPRIGSELRLLARERDPVSAFAILALLGVDGAIERGFGLGGDPALASRALALLPAEARPDLLAIALAARDLPDDRLEPLLDRLAFEASDRDVVAAAVRSSREVSDRLSRAGRPSEIAAAAAGASPELVALAGALGPERAAREWLDHISRVRLEIAGDDLIAAGIPEGPAVGRGLRAALAAKLDGLAGDREAELAQALAAARDTRSNASST